MTVAAIVKMLAVVSKKDGSTGVAEVLENGRVALTLDGKEVQEVAESTFKRWYKVTGTAPTPVVVPALVAAPTPEYKATVYTENEVGSRLTLRDCVSTGTRGGKCVKIKVQIELDNVILDMTEYDGFITDVTIVKAKPEFDDNDPEGGWETIYKSPKASLKDALEWLGYDEEMQSSLRKAIMALRKAAKAALEGN